jgi:integrase
MPRRRAAPRLYLDPGRQQWIIRDGAAFVRTGCVESDRDGAEKRLAAYLAGKHEPARSPSPLIADVLTVYGREHLPHIASAKNSAYNLASLGTFWADSRVTDITARNCRAYAAERTAAAARRDLEVLRAAIRYWHKNYGPLPAVPVVTLPARAPARERWLTRNEAARLLRAARHTSHLARFILLGLYTGNRPGATLGLTWDRVDLAHGVMYRRATGKAEDARKRTPPVRLGKRILTHLRRWRGLDGIKNGYLCHYNGDRVTKLRRSWQTAVQRAGLSGKITPHTLRHTRATWLMQGGIDAWEAAGALGMTLDMLQRTYGHHHPDWQRKAAEI